MANYGPSLFWEASLIGQTWALLKESVDGFMEDEALTRGAAIAFYTVTSIGPVLFIVVAIAGLVFGEDAASGAVSAQLGGLMGRQSAELLQTAIQNASGKLSGTLATLVGIVALVITASGVFTEMQQTLNVIWRAAPRRSTVSALLRSRATSLGLVAALGFLLLVSLVISAILTALSNYINGSASGRSPYSTNTELSRVVCFDYHPVRSNLSGSARPAHRVARCDCGRCRHVLSLHDW